MTLMLTCPSPDCAELNLPTRANCESCGRFLRVPRSDERKHYRQCVYCGRRSQPYSPTCRAHSSLLGKDPVYAEARL